MKTNKSIQVALFVVTIAIMAISTAAIAQSVTTDPVGFMTNTQLGSSDTFVSLSLIRPPAFLGGIQSAAGATIAISGNPWTANQFVYAAGSQSNHYYALIGPAGLTNPKEGHTYPITANTSNSITVDLGQDSLTGVPANAQLSIIPNWTFATVFPPGDQGVSFTATTSSSQYKTQIRVPDVSAAGVNLPYVSYFFSNNVDGTSGNVGWRLVGDNTTDHGDDPFLPDSHFVTRNLNGAPTLPLVNLGSVLQKKFTTPLVTSTSTAQDNPAAILRPLDVALNATGLNMADGSFGPGDQVLLVDNTVAGFDKLQNPSMYKAYVQTTAANGPWRLSTDPVNDRGSDIIPAGTGFIVRKALSDGQPKFWVNSFPVQAVSAVSRKTHGSAGDFDIPLPLSGISGVECRSNNGSYKIVFTFPSAVTFSGAAVTSGTVSSAIPTAISSTVVAVDLAGVNDLQAVTVTLLGVSDGAHTNDVAVRMRVLVGDVNGSGGVTSSDVAATKAAASPGTVDSRNFRNDVNVNGAISSSDIAIVKSKSGNSVPDASTDTKPGQQLTAAAR
ncbi:MAG: TIGR02597 family protein [Chthoniobacterales bacterium]